MVLSATLFLAGSIYFVREYRQLNQILDKYPDRLKGTIEKIKNSIDQKTYEYLTSFSKKPEELPENIEKILDFGTRIVHFKHDSKFILKSSSLAFGEGIGGRGEDPFGGRYRASNAEGGVRLNAFHLAKRVLVAKKLRKIIKTNHLTRIHVPKKYLCSFP